MKSLDLDDPPFIALPVYPSRQFRHAGIFVHADSGIQKPEDLRGAVVGTPEWQLTAGVWIRGVLSDHHGVPVASVEYRTGGQETPRRSSTSPRPGSSRSCTSSRCGGTSTSGTRGSHRP